MMADKTPSAVHTPVPGCISGVSANAWRREVVRELLLTLGWDRAGVLGEIAAQLGVSRSCVCRDRKRLERWW
jgi:hypothetical protein